jgi:ABC-type maltose transport system permease subunit
MAACLFVLAPVPRVFFIIQKYMVAGLGAGALKG